MASSTTTISGNSASNLARDWPFTATVPPVSRGHAQAGDHPRGLDFASGAMNSMKRTVSYGNWAKC